MADFINPYNFVPISSKAIHKDSGEKELTGFLDCKMHLKTPLIIPDSESKNDNSKKDHFEYKFYSHGNGPVVPASQLRGVIRNVYETVTDSCFSTSRNSPISMRTRDFNSTPGILKKNSSGSWDLYEAEFAVGIDCGYFNREQTINNYKNHGNKNVPKPMPEGLTKYEIKNHEIVLNDQNYSNFSKLKVDWFGNIFGRWAGINSDSEKYPYRGKSTGYILIMPKPSFGNKRYNHLMVESKNSKIEKNYSNSELVNILINQLDEYISNSKNEDNKKFYESMQDLIDNGVQAIPVWFRKVEDKYYIGFSQQGRITMNNTLHSVIGNCAPCKDIDNLCPACSLFGTVGDNNSAKHGKLRFCDAKYISEKKDGIYFKRTLDILGSPHISSTEFYLSKPYMAKYWNHDYYTKEYKPTTYNKKTPCNTFYTPGNPVKILGRKYYWHSKPKENDAEKSNMNSTFECLNEGEFIFRVYFDGISQTQLNALKWCLCFGENIENGYMCHKIGHGKPLGYGSVKINVCSTTIRTLNGSEYITSSTPDNKDFTSDGLKHTKDLLKISNFNAVLNENVSYPPGGYEWFTKNRGDFRAPEIKTTLPPIFGSVLMHSDEENDMGPHFTNGKEYYATVTSSTGKYAYLVLNDDAGKIQSKNCSASKTQNFKTGSKVKVKFTGKNGQFYSFTVLQF